MEEQWNEFSDKSFANWKRIRLSIEHENTLLNHRFTWLLTSQGFLIAAFALVFQAWNGLPASANKINYQYAVLIIAAVGAVTSFYLRYGLRAAEVQHEALAKWWDEYLKISGDAPGEHPPLCGTPPPWFKKMPYSYFPFFFSGVWLLFTIITSRDFFEQYSSIFIPVFRAAIWVFIGIGFGISWAKRRKKD